MLESVKIQRRQSEIREALAALVGKENPTEEETRSMEALDAEYRTNETRYRAALVAEDTERRDAGKELETREGSEWADLIGKFEVRQVALALDEGRALSGETAEVVAEMREKGGYRGIPVPYEALEIRVGETVSTGVMDPTRTMPIIDRIFAPSVAGRMGGQFINVPSGITEYPVTTSAVSAAWAATESGDVGAASAYATTDKPLSPDHTLGVQMKLTRKALKQSGAALEAAVRRDMTGAIMQEFDHAIFQGSNVDGEPNGVITGTGAYGISETNAGGNIDWSWIRAGIVRLMTASAASSESQVRFLCHPSSYDKLDDLVFDAGSGITQWDKLLKVFGPQNVVVSANAVAAPSGGTLDGEVLLNVSTGGVAPFFVATWGAIDMIRDPYSDATSGGLRITGLTTMDVTVARGAQSDVINLLQHD